MSDTSVPQARKVVDNQAGAKRAIDGDGVHTVDGASGDNEGYLDAEVSYLIRLEARPEQEDAVDAVAEEPVDGLLLFRGVAISERRQDAVAAPVGFSLRLEHDLGEQGVFQIGDDQP